MSRIAATVGEATPSTGTGTLTIRRRSGAERPRGEAPRARHASALRRGAAAPASSTRASQLVGGPDSGSRFKAAHAAGRELDRRRRKGIGEARHAAVQAAIELARRHLPPLVSHCFY